MEVKEVKTSAVTQTVHTQTSQSQQIDLFAIYYRYVLIVLMILTLVWTRDTYTNVFLRVCFVVFLCNQILSLFFACVWSSKTLNIIFETFDFTILLFVQIFYFKESDAIAKFVSLFLLVIKFYVSIFVFFVCVCWLCVSCCCPRGNRPVPPRTAARILRQLEIRVVLQNSEQTCPICLEMYQQGDEIETLPCKHEFHKTCVNQWLTTSGRTCPICRNNVVDHFNLL